VQVNLVLRSHKTMPARGLFHNITVSPEISPFRPCDAGLGNAENFLEDSVCSGLPFSIYIGQTRDDLQVYHPSTKS